MCDQSKYVSVYSSLFIFATDENKKQKKLEKQKYMPTNVTRYTTFMVIYIPHFAPDTTYVPINLYLIYILRPNKMSASKRSRLQ